MLPNTPAPSAWALCTPDWCVASGDVSAWLHTTQGELVIATFCAMALVALLFRLHFSD